ncbi:Stress responsive A/B Barrel Domain [Paucidesulfovibrio gracilis DSM 16080]|uniref:Stress responsive A/B Barrel Domain n=1 Tax=Paucidesulfovibrio gracilis DSM 16080 TaxID=1121449 RepID=A0A1T4Y072_9BACT|nr:Dabb family protein [Paucidesulfovibrio gracilis]SKA95023.1 Stress responsive A/B Barrel Domain [Paucidesulfovibrio gracilis DSM 16080]
MIKHIVMWKLKPEALGNSADENAAKMKQMLEALQGVIPVLRSIEVSHDIRESVPECDVLLFSEFDNMDDLSTYATHPAHLECVDFIKQVVSERRVVDYAI